MLKEKFNEFTRSILKVISPWEGTAFVAAPSIAISCAHVVIPKNEKSDQKHEVKLRYKEDIIYGSYLPSESDPEESDLAVIVLYLPKSLEIPPVSLSTEFKPGTEVVAIGIPAKQTQPHPIPGVIFDKFPLVQVTFQDGWTFPVLHIDTRRQGFWNDFTIYSGMSGGPIWDLQRKKVIAIIEGKKPRLNVTDPPIGYGITLDHLIKCSKLLAPWLRAEQHQRMIKKKQRGKEDKKTTKITWEDVRRGTLRVIEQLKKDKFEPDIIVGIARSGAIWGGILAGNLGLLPIITVNREYEWDPSGIRKIEIIFPEGIDAYIRGKKVLLVDGRARTGETLHKARDALLTMSPKLLKSASLIKSTVAIFKADYYGLEKAVPPDALEEVPWKITSHYREDSRWS